MAAAASIPVVLMKILPWTNGTNDQHVVRNDWNSALASRASSVVLVVDLDDELGQFKTGGVALNHDDILTAYDSDGVHFNVTGYTAMAAGINTAIEASPTFEALCLGTAGTSTLLLADDAISGTTPYDENQVQIISGTGAGQARRIISQSARTVTLDRAWDTVPDRTSRYKIVGQAADNTTIASRLATSGYTAPDNSSILAILEDTGTTIPATLAGLSTFTAGGEVTLADGAITAAKFAVGAIDASAIAADAIGSSELAASAVTEIVAAIQAFEVESGVTFIQACRLIAAANGGKISGAGTTTEVIKGAGTSTTRITATVDSSGNRSVVDLNL